MLKVYHLFETEFVCHYSLTVTGDVTDQIALKISQSFQTFAEKQTPLEVYLLKWF